MKHRFEAFAILLMLAGTPAHALTLEFIGQQTLPTGTQVLGTTLGGLSGIDFNSATGDFNVISDDRSQINPARYYTLQLALTSSAFTGVAFTQVTTLKTTLGAAYPILSIDPESIRNLTGNQIVYTSEGDVNNGIDAFIRIGNADGSFVRDVTLPTGFQQTGPAGTTGIRNNLAFESITVSPDGTRLTTATENALRQDGPGASFGVGSQSRIVTFDLASGTPGAQYVYEVNPVAIGSTPAGAFSTNGLVELLDEGNGKYLAVERSFITGYTTPWSTTGNSIQIYEIDTAGATDVSGLASLTGQSVIPVGKSLVFDLDSLKIPLDNIEGITWGPTLDDGSKSLILVSDNNFAASQFTQFIAFKVAAVPEPASWAMMIGGFALAGASLRRQRASVLVLA
jgi:hypothetical protein